MEPTTTTHIYYLLDSSSSMESIKDRVIQSMNEFLMHQRQIPHCYIHLFAFSNTIKIISQCQEIQKVRLLDATSYIPYGSSALYDAIGMILTTQFFNEKDINMFILLTDGMENSSYHFHRTQIQHLIQKHQKFIHFMWIGSHQYSTLVGKELGINHDACLSFDDEGIECAIQATRDAILRYHQDSSRRLSFS